MGVNGAAIRALRQAHGWTVSKFAIACGMSHSYLSNIEAGRKTQVGADKVRKIADVLGVPLAAITTKYRVEEVA